LLADISLISSWPWAAQSVVRLAAAAVLGALVGAEREYRGRSAGFRTQLLVALGSALAMLVSLNFARQYGAADDAIRVDPARVAYGVMGGIGFIGAGAIIRYGAGVRGLTTAASLWCTAAVGLACGFGMFLVAAVTTALVLFALKVLAVLDAHIPSRWTKTLTVTLPASGEDNLSRLRDILRKARARVTDVDYDRDLQDKTETLTLHLSISPRTEPRDLAALLEEVPGVCRFRLK